MSRWSYRKLVSCPTIQLKVFPRIPSIILPPPTSHRYFSNSQLELKGSNEENEWERLLKPFDLKELRRTLSHRITPFQLCKLLHLPLDVSISMELFNRVGAQKGYMHTFDVYYALIDKLGGSNDFKSIDKLLVQMKEEGIVFKESLCKCENMSEAMQIFGEMSSKGCKPDIFTFNTLILGLCKANIMEDSMRLFHDMVLEGVIADSVTYNTLIHAFLRRNDIQEAIKLMNDMVFRGCALNETTYNGLIRALCTARAVEKGLGLFDEMIRKGLVPSNISVNIVINGLCRAGQMNNAMELLRDMIHRGIEPDIVTYNSLINGFCKMGCVDEALNIFHKLVVEGIQPDAVTYNTLICWHCRKGMVDDAYSLLDRGVKNKFIPNQVTWNILVHNIVKDATEMEYVSMASFIGFFAFCLASVSLNKNSELFTDTCKLQLGMFL
ncbi:unnamed protein product [Linum trigynum]|uniref:Pentatricopeptide repeat-containing protein n=1 Tax=Linum trigynum TaxID=586398 RepID=A0AAV2F6C9_9ROSI